MISIETLKTTNIVLIIFVSIHIGLEMYHYFSEWIKNRRDKKMLEHLDDHLDNMGCSCDGKCKDTKEDNST